MRTKKSIPIIMAGACLFFSSVSARGEDALRAGSIAECDLQQAIDLAVQNNPELKSAALDLDGADANIWQAGLWANPTLEMESENFSGDNPGFSRAENTLSISQPFTLGGKIKHQKQIATKEKEIARLQYEAAKRDLILKVEETFYEVLLARKNVDYAMEAQTIAQNLYDFYAKKAAEKESTPEMLSAEIELSQTTIEVINAGKSLESAKKNLVVLWGGAEIVLGECKGDLDRVFKVPDYNEIRRRILENNPELQMTALQEEKGDFLLQAAKSERIPDVDLALGVRRFEEDDNYALVASLSVPLPLFNRNQGSIQEALVNQKKVKEDGNATKNRLLYELNEVYRTFEAARKQVDIFKKSILPKTERYFAATRESYHGGALEYLEVLEAQRMLVDTKKNYVELLKTLQSSVANLARLCSSHFHGKDGEMF
jgi:cobalt-zinc-cadmium efflux system outer membrane protein